MSKDGRRKVAIIGAGLAGATAGLGFVEAGFDVPIYSDRDRASLRDGVPPTGTAIYFGKSLEYDAEIIDDLYNVGTITGLSLRLATGLGETRAPVLEFDPPFSFRAQAIDVRLRADDRLARFLARGGNFQVRSVTPDDLDKIAAGADLTLVATGKGGLSSLFPVDASRNVYSEQQRHLLLATFKGLDHGSAAFGYRSSEGAKHAWFNLHTDFGELFLGPYLHKDLGPTWTFLGFAKPGSPWIDSFKSVTDTHSAREVVVALYEKYFPEDVGIVEQLQPLHEDPRSWLVGAVTPTVRQAVVNTASGHVVAAIGDAAVAVDPLAGQGAQNAVVQVALLLRAATRHSGEFTREWLIDQFNKYWQLRGEAASEVTRLFLGDPKYAQHAKLIFPAAAVNRNVATGFFSLLSEPERLLALRTREDILGFIEERADEPAENVLAKFKSPEAFSRAEAFAPA
jgi:flavin-dependent dehydrogenase